ncbi:MAG: helix-turn-helix domain-containing protein, partial [Elusimicrobiota bacterium]|nr:helix-turn-helix domain-containing protein [Elusimicrobiota bacterium]
MEKEVKRPIDASGKPMLNRKEIAEKLGVSKFWMSKMVNPRHTSHIMPYRKIGRNYWFIAEQIDEWNTIRR